MSDLCSAHHRRRAMMESDVKLLGRIAIYEQAGSPHYTEDSGGGTITRTYQGPMEILLQNRPAIGATTSEAGYYLVSSDCKPITPACIGELTLVYSNKNEYTWSNENPETVIEVEWSQIEKPLATHPRYSSISQDDLKKVEDILSGKLEATEVSGVRVQEYLEKRLRGVDSYLVFAPVVRKTSTTRNRPGTGSCGQISSPPIGVSGFQFLKTADSARQSSLTRVWERSEEWTGADKWDSDIYG